MKLRTFAFAVVGSTLLPAVAGAQSAPPSEKPSAPPVMTPAPAEPPPAASVAPVVVPPAAPVVAPVEEKKPEEPRAKLDYSDGTFYLRSKNDNIVLFPGGRAHIDTYAFAGPGVKDYQRSNGTGLKADMFFRRFILELGGLVRGKWFFYMGGNFAPTRVDDNEASTPAANVYDGWLGYAAGPEFKILGGQFNTPVSMENTTSSRWLDLMERSITARLASPYNKDIGVMAFGSLNDGLFDYFLAAVGGDGMNRMSVDNRWDGNGRFVFRPLATSRKDALKKLHIGASGRYGHRDPDYVWYEAPAISSPGGYNFWSAAYGKAPNRVRIIPSGAQLAVGGEAYVPLENFDLRFEGFYFDEHRREAPLDVAVTQTLRSGALKGTSWYAQLSWWPWGSPRVNGDPGTFGTPKLPKDSGREAPGGLQIVARYEQVRLKYDSNTIAGDTKGSLDAKFSDIKINAYQLGVNYWATKHVRVTAEYSLYQTPKDQQALAPGARGTANDADATLLHELSFRLGLAL